MKSFFFAFVFFISFIKGNSQSVAINTDKSAPNASAMLDIKSTTKGLLIPRLTLAQRNAVATPATGLLVYQTDNTPGYYYYNGAAWAALAGPGGSSYWTANATNLYNSNTGSVGIGTTAPVEKLTVQTTNNTYGISHRGEGGNLLSTYMGGSSAGIGTFSNTNMRIFANNYSAIFIAEATGNVGINTDDNNPLFKLDVAGRMRLRTQSDGNTAGIWLNNPTNTTPIAFVGIADASTVGIYGNNSSWGLAMNTNTGNVGIQTLVPTNRLQIGSLGNTGFAGNDLAIGNGTNALGIYQSNNATLIGSTTDIILKPRNNGQGRVGINTNTPRAPLDVSYAANVNTVNSNYGYGYLSFNNANDVTGFSTDDNPVQNVSIIASGRVYASEFDAFSDARIKNITGVSNAGKDLETLNELHITNYTLKDKAMYGDQQFKKVIAQEVEKVYPQVVSKHTDFIPNVYQLTSNVTKIMDGYLLSFTNGHHINGNAKKLQVIMPGESGMQQFDIVSIPSANEVLINATDLKGDKLFVYGEEVDDFRTVDYEGLTTLNISATQELSRLVKLQNKKIAVMEQTIELLKTRPVIRPSAD
jgi:Chaperone of endosialidase